MVKCCLVTICIGDKYIKEYNTRFKPSQENYAKKCGYDFKVITDYIREPFHPSVISLNKILVCDYMDKKYDFIIFVDADIIIHKNAPPLHNYYDFGDKVGVVSQSQPNQEEKIRIEREQYVGFEISAKEYYKSKSNHELETDIIINTGVLVIQPQIHMDFLRNIFLKYSKKQLNNVNKFHYEQSVIGYELQKRNMYFLMDMKWNALWENNKYFLM